MLVTEERTRVVSSTRRRSLAHGWSSTEAFSHCSRTLKVSFGDIGLCGCDSHEIKLHGRKGTSLTARLICYSLSAFDAGLRPACLSFPLVCGWHVVASSDPTQ
jgi:hypothetical protein